MKRIILVVLVSVFLSGCLATTKSDPVVKAVQIGAITAFCGIGAYEAAKAVGANRPIRTVAAAAGLGVCYYAASESLNPSPQDSQGGLWCNDQGFGCGRDKFGRPYSNRDANGYWANGMYVPNGCTQLETGGYVCSGPKNTQRSYSQQQNSGSTTGSALYGNLTVENYLRSEIIPPKCKSGNFGADAICLSAESQKLAKMQEDCEAGKGRCSSELNFGAAAGAFSALASRLQRRQSQLQARGY